MNAIKVTWALFVHYEKLLIRNPYWILSALFQPVCYLYLFAPLLQNVLGDSGGVSPINQFTPGLLVMVSLFGAMYVGFGIIEYLRSGVIERLRVTTASRVSLLMGMVLRDVVTLLIQAFIVIFLAMPLGLTISPIGILLSAAIMVMIGFFMSPVSYALALTVKSEDALGPILNFFSQPMLLLSGVLLPLTLAPAWLLNVSYFNPVKYMVDASRAIFNGDLSNPAVWQGFLLMGVLVVAAFWWSMRCMKKAME
ncbi:MAG: ABC transporter permease [Eubacteriales bacterium]